MTAAELAAACRAAWEAPFATEFDPRYLLLLAANELERLTPPAPAAPPPAE